MKERQPTPGVHQNFVPILDDSGLGSGMGFGPNATGDEQDLCPICQVAFPALSPVEKAPQPRRDPIEIGAAISRKYHGASTVPLDLAEMIADAIKADRAPPGEHAPQPPAPETHVRGEK